MTAEPDVEWVDVFTHGSAEPVATLPVPYYADGATQAPPDDQDPSVGQPWTEDTMLRVLWRHFLGQSWAALPQVTVALRDSDHGAQQALRADATRALLPEHRDRRIDLLAVRTPRRRDLGPLETLAIEVKVTRADFLNDLKHPEKQEPWRRAATRHAYAAPKGLVSPSEVPEASGLLVVSWGPAGWGEVEWARRAPYRPGHAPQPPTRVLAALMHRAGALEGATRGWNTSPEAAGTEDDLRAALKAAHRAAERANARADRADALVDSWRTLHALAVPAGHPCRWCREPLKPLNPHGGWFKKWRHLSPEHDAPCREAERAAAEADARAAYDAATPDERARAVRRAHQGHRDAYNPTVDADPWRAFIVGESAWDGSWHPTGPYPLDVLDLPQPHPLEDA